jgi:hypothetical protein
VAARRGVSIISPVVPALSRDPYRVIYRSGDVADGFANNDGRWLWVPAFAGTTKRTSLFHALKYAIWVVVASSRPFGDHNSPF